MNDTYKVGQAGAVGPNAHAEHMTFTQQWNEAAADTDLGALAEQLAKLRQAMKSEATALDQDKAVGAVAEAEDAARKGDGPTVFQRLAAAGKWALDMAIKIGAEVAATALKKSLGLP